jgi:DNA-binding transcriptional LysR family regulator
MTKPKQDVLIARRVADVIVGWHAHRDYLSRHGTPKKLSDLSQHSLIGFDVETPFIRSAKQKLPGWGREDFSLRTDSDLAQLALIRAGCGIGGCQVGLAKRDPSLVRVLPKQLELKLETWIAMHEDLRGSPRCKVTFDALVKALA